jgi:hypothetical protein
MVVVDPTQIAPLRYEDMAVLGGIIGKSSLRIDVREVMTNQGWRSINAAVDVTGERWQTDYATGTQHVLQETKVKATDPHIDAKVFAHLREPQNCALQRSAT